MCINGVFTSVFVYSVGCCFYNDQCMAVGVCVCGVLLRLLYHRKLKRVIVNNTTCSLALQSHNGIIISACIAKVCYHKWHSPPPPPPPPPPLIPNDLVMFLKAEISQ